MFSPLGGDGKANANRGSKPGPLTHNIEPAAICRNESAGDPKSETGSGCRGGVARTAKRPLTGELPLIWRQSDSLIGNRQFHPILIEASVDLDRRARGRIFRGIFEQLAYGILDQSRLHLDQGK